jgi:hypothetical protein
VDEGVDEAAPVQWCSVTVVIRYRGGERDKTRGDSNFAWVAAN